MRCDPFSALGRAVWDETMIPPEILERQPRLSVLSVEPYGMKPGVVCLKIACYPTFSALGRAVWDETARSASVHRPPRAFQCSRSSRMG